MNENYQDFLSLGQSLKGGEEKVEEVRVGMLGFRRDVEGLRNRVLERKVEVGTLIQERASARKEIVTGRKLLEVDQRLEELEARLLVHNVNGPSNGIGEDDVGLSLTDSDEDSDEEGVGNAMSTGRLQGHVRQYIYIKRLIEWTGTDHPFLRRQEERLLRLRNTLLLDLCTAMKHAKGGDEQSKTRMVKIMGIYQEMGEERDALRVLEDIR